MNRLTFLGTGASAGIPVIGCHCAVCTSSHPKNRRLRTSALLEIEGKTLLIDPGPDLREQALTHDIDHLDGVLITHSHYDHIGGLDELRAFYFKTRQPLPCVSSKETMEDLQRRCEYLFKEHRKGHSLPARLDFEPLMAQRGEGTFQGLQFRYMTFEQGGMPVLGFRFGRVAYVSDIRVYPESIFEDLDGVELLVVSALRHTSSPLHFSIDEAVEFVERVGASEAYLVHMAHEIDHDQVNAELPEKVRLAYDGLTVEF